MKHKLLRIKNFIVAVVYGLGMGILIGAIGFFGEVYISVSEEIRVWRMYRP